MPFNIEDLLRSLGQSNQSRYATNDPWGMLRGALNYQDVPQNVPASDEGGDIIVEAIRNKPQKSPRVGFPAAPDRPIFTNGPEAPDLGNRNYVEASRAALSNNPRRGGTLRNILGVLGDAFLVQGGADPVYAPRRQQEKMQDALSGFTANPLAAVERMAQVSAPDAAKLYDTYVDNETKATQARAQEEAYKRQANTAAQEQYDKSGRLFSQYAGTASPETWAKLAPILRVIKQRGGLGDEYQIPDQFDEGLMNTYQYGGMPTQQQVSTELRSKQLDQTKTLETMKEAGRMKRDHPPAPRSAPQPTAASLAAPLIRKVQNGQPLTSGESETLVRLGYPANRGQGKKGGRTPPPLPPGFSVK